MAVLDDATATAPGRTMSRLVPQVRSTPQSLRAWIAASLAMAALAGFVAVASLAQRYEALDRAATTTEPVLLDAQTAYTSLSDADSTAAGGLLSGAVAPAAVVAHYRGDIATAAAAIGAAQQLSEGDDGLAQALETVAVGLPVYTGLVERASGENRRGYPVASAYLGEASAYLRSTLLPAAGVAYRDELATLQSDQDAASAAVPELAALASALGLLGVILAAHVWVRRRFHRRFNVALISAAVIVVVATALAGVVVASADGSVDRARSAGSLPLLGYTQARILALQLRADDELTLLTRESVPAYQKDLAQTLAGLQTVVGAQPDTRVDSALSTLVDTHARIRSLVQGNAYTAAVALAVLPGDSASSGLPAASSHLDQVLSDDVAAATTSFDSSTSQARSDVGALAGITLLLVLLAGVLCVVGLRARLREYR
jgi:hypothetical protein